jgi:formylglycine-generating enzyme required for sulfatase activity
VSFGKDGWKQRGATWKEPGFEQGPTHPVVGVSWEDASEFCEWLTKLERGSGTLPEGVYYRLPTDGEWSVAAGLDSEPGKTPEEKNSKIQLGQGVAAAVWGWQLRGRRVKDWKRTERVDRDRRL